MLNSKISWIRDIAVCEIRKTHARRHAQRQRTVFQLLYKEGEVPRVLNGPFAGMRYLNEPVWGSITPRWIGSYESCLHSVIREIIRSGYSRVIDVGCAEGYYAVGLCRALPTSEVLAYDMDIESRAQVLRLWVMNGSPGKLTVGGLLDHAELNRIVRSNTVLVCDIEGGEIQLLNPTSCSALKNMDVLVEVHQTGSIPMAVNAATLRERFRSSHEVMQINESADAVQLNHVSHLAPEQLKEAIAEGRPHPQIWLWLKVMR